jgi:A/G-specific adenine glycosylase
VFKLHHRLKKNRSRNSHFHKNALTAQTRKTAMARVFSFSAAVLKWFDHSGRKHLPWQQDITPYRVWLSEIMLQQTQVSTVIPYFEKFTSLFPDVASLASAPSDEVLALWTGLGYYSRARNLHRTAKIISAEHHCQFPDNIETLMELPGIGRSTAAAIISIAYNKKAAILDGNVKRVLARFHAVAGWPGDTAVAKILWQHAEKNTPEKRAGDYTQAMMDIGATVCTRSRPRCDVCPLRSQCAAYWQESISLYPGRKAKKTLPVKAVKMLMIRNPAGEVLLQQRPPVGLWGGLWCLPEISASDDIAVSCKALCQQKPGNQEIWTSWRHSFSHYHLDITPVLIDLLKAPMEIAEPGWRWVNPSQRLTIGLPAPLVRLFAQLAAC